MKQILISYVFSFNPCICTKARVHQTYFFYIVTIPVYAHYEPKDELSYFHKKRLFLSFGLLFNGPLCLIIENKE